MTVFTPNCSKRMVSFAFGPLPTTSSTCPRPNCECETVMPFTSPSSPPPWWKSVD